MRVAVLVAWASLVVTIHAQTPDTGKLVYSSSQESVFLIYLNDATGSPDALGSGFLVAPHVLVTNAHVAEAGNPVLAVGPVRIPLKIINLDKSNDLATLSFVADITSKPLPLATDPIMPGEEVFAIGNPEGLEKTISQGIVSGTRTNDGRELIQITAPISHGSSGGPVFNAKGEVIGVAVGMLEDGQNLNFAVPIRYVSQLLARKAESAEPFNLQETLDSISELRKSLVALDYSADSSSAYQAKLQQLQEKLRDVVQNTEESEALKQVSCTSEYGLDEDLPISAARKIVNTHPGAENEAFLAYVLYRRASFDKLSVILAKDDTDKAKAQTIVDRWFNEASDTAQRSLRAGKGNTLLLADFVLGSAKDDEGAYTDAIALNARVASGNVTECGTSVSEVAVDNLISENEQANHPEEAEKWFKLYASNYSPTSYEWDTAGDRRWKLHDMSGSATAYEKAANGSTYLAYDYCYAAKARYLEPATDADALLADGRSCVDASLKSSDGNKNYFDQSLPDVYADMADVLEKRGVYQGALQYAKEAVHLKPNDPHALYEETEIFFDLNQINECISAGEAAIRASDGKYPFMQFRLGTCYFASENWTMAENSFRIAAESDKADCASAYNLGLSLRRQGRLAEGNEWLREALKRNPDAATRTQILDMLQ